MILDFRMKEYVCNYYAGKKYHKEICFSKDFNGGEYGRYAYATYIWPKKKQEERNYCFFDKKTLFEYFTEISKLLGFRLLSFSETKDSYKLQVQCIPNRRYFIYASMCIRYVWEHPFAILLYAAWQNKENFPELDIIQIMQFYIAFFFDGRRCHCPGVDRMAFYNINSKCQFSLIRDDFNYDPSFLEIQTSHISLTHELREFNTKQLPQIASGINFIANKYYAKNKKDICRW